MKTTAPKPNTEAAIPCFECESGALVRELRDHTLDHPKLGEITIPNVPVLVCHSCGDRVIGDEGNQLIDAFLDQVPVPWRNQTH